MKMLFIFLVGLFFVFANLNFISAVIQEHENNYSSGVIYDLGLNDFQRVGQKKEMLDFNIEELGFYLTQGYLDQNISSLGYDGSSLLLGNVTGGPNNMFSSYCSGDTINNRYLKNFSLAFYRQITDEPTGTINLTIRRNSTYEIIYSEYIIDSVDLINETFDEYYWTSELNIFLDGDYLFCVDLIDDTVALDLVNVQNKNTALESLWAYDLYGSNWEHTANYELSRQIYFHDISGDVNFSIRSTNDDSLIDTKFFSNSSDIPFNSETPILQKVSFNNTFLNEEVYFSVDYNGTGKLKVFAGGVLGSEAQSVYNESSVSWSDKDNDLGYYIKGDDNTGTSPLGGGGGGVDISDYNPSVYPLLIEAFKKVFYFDNISDLPSNIMDFLFLLVKFIFRQPASLVDVGGVL